MHRHSDGTTSVRGRDFRRLNPDRAKGLAVDRMSDRQLWEYALTGLSRVRDSIDRSERIDAFYDVCRIQRCVEELRSRGVQLSAFLHPDDRGTTIDANQIELWETGPPVPQSRRLRDTH